VSQVNREIDQKVEILREGVYLARQDMERWVSERLYQLDT